MLPYVVKQLLRQASDPVRHGTHENNMVNPRCSQGHYSLLDVLPLISLPIRLEDDIFRPDPPDRVKDILADPSAVPGIEAISKERRGHRHGPLDYIVPIAVDVTQSRV